MPTNQKNQQRSKKPPRQKEKTLFDMPSPDALARHDLLSRPVDLSQGATLPSGYPDLDRHLQGGGWPQQGLMELLLPQAGIGELRLLLPVLNS